MTYKPTQDTADAVVAGVTVAAAAAAATRNNIVNNDINQGVQLFKGTLCRSILKLLNNGNFLGKAVQDILVSWNKAVIDHGLLTKRTEQFRIDHIPHNVINGTGLAENHEWTFGALDVTFLAKNVTHDARTNGTSGPAMGAFERDIPYQWMDPVNRAAADEHQPFSFLNVKSNKPFREERVNGEDGNERYTIKRGRITNVENTFMYANSTMSINVGWVLDAYEHDIVGRAIALAYLSTPIHRDVFDTMLGENIHLPTEYLVLRPWMGYAMSAMVVAEGGVAMGESIYGYGDTKMSWATKNKSGDLHRTEWFGAIMYDYFKRIVIRHAFYEACHGGAGHRFYTDEHIARYITDREEYDVNEERPSILVCSIPYGSDVRNEALDICGKIWSTDQLNYATAAFYKIRYMFAKMNNQYKSLLQSVDRPRKNTVTFQGTSCQCGNINGDPGPLIENKGHHGKERPGSAGIRRNGMTIMSPNAPSFY